MPSRSGSTGPTAPTGGAGSTVQFVYDGTYWQTCNTPLYGSTATIGNPAGYHVYIDGDSVSVMNGASLLSEFQGNSVRLCGGTMTIAADSGTTSEDSRMTFHGGSFSFDPAVTGGFSVGGSSVATLRTLNGYKGLGASNADYSSWMRTPSAGLLPYQSGGASALGTSSWPFTSVYASNLYAGGTQLTGDGHWLYATGGAFSELCTNKSSAYPVYGAKVLYDNGSGVWGTITLNETAANFRYMEFFYKKPEGDHFWTSSRVHEPHNKRVGFIVAQVAPGSVTQTLMGGVAIVGTSVSIYTMSRYNNGSAWAMDSTTLRIYRIVGYR